MRSQINWYLFREKSRIYLEEKYIFREKNLYLSKGIND